MTGFEQSALYDDIACCRKMYLTFGHPYLPGYRPIDLIELLLDPGAAIDRTVGWSPLEEALYWNNQDVIALLPERGEDTESSSF